MILFHLIRIEDVSGVSGEGVVAEGVEFTDKSCCLRWYGDLKSFEIHDSIENLLKIHGHTNKTKIEYDTGSDECGICGKDNPNVCKNCQ